MPDSLLYYFYGFDYTYFIYILPAVILSLIAQLLVKSSFLKYSAVINRKGLTGAEAARRVLMSHGVQGVSVERVSGNLTDHYDPKARVIRLSDAVYDSASVAAVGVASHEAGHAVQHAVDYAPIKIRNTIYPVVNFGSSISWIVIMLGFLFSFEPLTLAGIILFSFTVVFQLVTLPVEFNASRRAMETIESESLLADAKEIGGARRVLTAAALTYVAAAITSIMQLIRLLAIFGRRRD